MTNQRISCTQTLLVLHCLSFLLFYANSQPIMFAAPTFVKMSNGVIWPSLLLRPTDMDNENIFSQNPQEFVKVATPRKRAIMRLGKRALMRLGKK
uniref:Uncharacterized protein n=1 Tax=Meloidogyne enterolobii TaxID=390850 RepID=A0A6V7TV44_MELEN|nr:unnamed protein product [Meloidogyne enterolobii]